MAQQPHTGDFLKSRIQGFGNSDLVPLPREPAVEVIPEVDYLWHALVDIGETMGLSSVLEAVDYAVNGSAHRPPQKLPKLEGRGVSQRLQQWGPGTYRILVKDVIVSADLELGGRGVASLQPGTIVEVLDVVYRPYEQRLRGRIEMGWISLLNTEDGSYWVTKVRSQPSRSDCEQRQGSSSRTSANLDERRPSPSPEHVLDTETVRTPESGSACHTASMPASSVQHGDEVYSSMSAGQFDDIFCQAPMPRIPPPPGPPVRKPADRYYFPAAPEDLLTSDMDNVVDAFAGCSDSGTPLKSTWTPQAPPGGLSIFDPLSVKDL